MLPAHPDPARVHPALARLAQQARRIELPCGSGMMVWHVWEAGPAQQGGASAPLLPLSPLPSLAPLVLLHGGSGSWKHWVRNIEALTAAGRSVWAADLPGFGDSALPPAGIGGAQSMAGPLAQALQQLFGGLACDLVGFSFGALVAAALLAGHGSLARQLVLVGAPAMGVAPQRQFTLRGWRHLPPAQHEAVHRHNLAELMLADPALIDADGGLALQLHTANVQRDRLPRRRAAASDALARLLGQVACPVHAIYGQCDALYRQWITELETAYAAAAPDFRGLALIQDAGHWVQFERPQAFHQALLLALQRGARP